MSLWRHMSRFYTYIEEHPSFFATTSPAISFDDQSLFQATNALHRLSARLPTVHPLAQRLQKILDFAQTFQNCSTSMQSEQLFEKLQPLRSWLFWMPVTLVKSNDMSTSAMVLLAQLYTMALAIDTSIPELSGAALGSLTVHAIEQIDVKLRYKTAITTRGEMNTMDLDDLMQFVRLMVAQHQLQETTSHEVQSRGSRQQSPYSFNRLSVGSQPGTPNYPPPSNLTLLPNSSFEELSIPPSPFLNYGDPVSRRHSQQFVESSPRPSEHSFDNRSISGYSLRGDSPAYSPAAYSPVFPPDDETWSLGGHSPSFTGGFVISTF